jgi:putative flippase GtrA
VFVLVLLSEWIGVLPELATLAGIETAILVMFLVNERWTFASHGPDDRASFFARLKRSHAVRAAGVTTQYLIFLVLYRGLYVSVSLADLTVWQWVVDTVGTGMGLGGLDVWLLVAKGAGIGIGMLVNYVFESVFTWQVHLD